MDGASVAQATVVGTQSLDYEAVGVLNTWNSTTASSGNPAIVWRNSSTGAIQVWQMDGVGNINNTINLGTAPTGANTAANITLADLNGDGNTDIVFRSAVSGSNDVTFWTLTTDPDTLLLTKTVTTQTSPGADWDLAGAGNFSGTANLARACLVWRNRVTGSLRFWNMNTGGTTFTAPADLTGTATHDMAWSLIGIGDFNNDGKADLLWRKNVASGGDVTNDMDLWLMNSATSKQSSTTFTSPGTAWSLASSTSGIGDGKVDFNADNKRDLLWRNASTGQLSLWQMNG
jgi:hypothetical protein